MARAVCGASLLSLLPEALEVPRRPRSATGIDQQRSSMRRATSVIAMSPPPDRTLRATFRKVSLQALVMMRRCRIVPAEARP